MKLGPKKARVLFKMNGCRPFSYTYGKVGFETKRVTIFGVLKGERLVSSPNNLPSAYDTDQIFRECSAEEYMRRIEYREISLEARKLIDNMQKAILHSEYDQLKPMIEEIRYVSNRIHRIQQGSPVEPNAAH